MFRVAFRYDDKRWFSRLVCFIRGGDSAHCEAVRNYRPGFDSTCASASWVDGGVRYACIRLHPEKWRVYEVEGIPVDLIDTWMGKHQGEDYDLVGLLGVVLPTIFGHSTRRWFCSEVVANMLGMTDPHLYDLRVLESVCAKVGKRVQ